MFRKKKQFKKNKTHCFHLYQQINKEDTYSYTAAKIHIQANKCIRI